MIEPAVLKMAKSMKREFLELNSSYLIGTDVNRCTMSIIYHGSNEYYIGTLAELEGKKIPDYWIPNDRLKFDIDRLKVNCFHIIDHNKIIYKEDNLKENESFQLVESMKESQGSSIFKSFNYLMYSFSSLHPLNKPDSISMRLYEYDNISYLAEFIIQKKNYNINEYVRYLYL